MLIIIISCNKINDPLYSSIPKTESINEKYLIDKEYHEGINYLGGNTHFQYFNNKVLKRIGGYILIPSTSGFIKFHTNDVYDEVEYKNNNTIVLITKDRLNTLAGNKREITLKYGNIIKKITVFNQYADTIHYYYDSKNRLNRTDQYLSRQIITKSYSFDRNDNLQKIFTVQRMRDGQIANHYTSEEHFGGYDNTKNPLKGFVLWQDIFYRSLSRNNFTTYTFSDRNNFERLNWELNYDIHGYADFSR